MYIVTTVLVIRWSYIRKLLLLSVQVVQASFYEYLGIVFIHASCFAFFITITLASVLSFYTFLKIFDITPCSFKNVIDVQWYIVL